MASMNHAEFSVGEAAGEVANKFVDGALARDEWVANGEIQAVAVREGKARQQKNDTTTSSRRFIFGERQTEIMCWVYSISKCREGEIDSRVILECQPLNHPARIILKIENSFWVFLFLRTHQFSHVIALVLI